MPFYTIAPSSRRNMHYGPFSPVLFGHGPRYSLPCAPRSNPASLVPTLFKDLESEFSSLDSFFDDLLSPHSSSSAIRSFQPRFDVREEQDAFYLNGDLPGVESGNIAVEFTDRDTLVIKGRTVREKSSGKAPTIATTTENKKAVEGTEVQARVGDAMDAEPTISRPSTPNSTGSGSSNYHKATVEESRDEADDFVDVAAESNEATTSATAEKQAPAESTETTATAVQQPSKPSAEEEQGRYWVSERSVGEFSRSFRFPGAQADRDNVTASLKDGVLKVIVPKTKQQGPRSIRVE